MVVLDQTGESTNFAGSNNTQTRITNRELHRKTVVSRTRAQIRQSPSTIHDS